MQVKYYDDFYGKEFNTIDECRKFESNFRKLLFGVKFYKGRKLIKCKTDEDLQEVCNSADKMIFPSIDSKKAYDDYIGMCSIPKNGCWTTNPSCLRYKINEDECCWQEAE